MPVCTGAPVEEALRTCGSICMDRLLWQAVDKLAASNFAKNMDMILMGQSFGVTVARCLSLRMDAIGFPARGLIALDCRCAERAARDIYVVPLALRQSMTSSSWRCLIEEFHFVSPRVPRINITARHFDLRARLDAEMSVVSAKAFALNVMDSDHFDLPVSHCWDLSRLVSQIRKGRRRTRRKGPVIIRTNRSTHIELCDK
ncbi:unnamed protein product [Durusdinium trenchii]|uniref:Uncharacterized protein n=2 Tax=Durusdinium trenchii TaxID=1381693 RepID=A0ABP0NP96_9DINO